MRSALPFLLLVACGCSEAPRQDSPSAAPPAETQPVPAVPGRQIFEIVPAESKASYVAHEEFFAGALKKLGIKAGKTTVVGTTQAIEGQFEFDPARPSATLGDNSFTVRMNTFVTDQAARDRYIRESGPGFDRYPAAVFKATSIVGEGLEFALAGNLTVREITRPATFEVKAELAGDRLAGIATTRVKMSDFGIEPLDFYNTLTVADEIGIEVRFTARPRDPRGRP